MTLTIHNYITGLVKETDAQKCLHLSKGRFSSIDGRISWINNPGPDQKLPLAVALRQIRTELDSYGNLVYRNKSNLEKLRRRVAQSVLCYDNKYCFLTQFINFLRFGSVYSSSNAIFRWVDTHGRDKLEPLEKEFESLDQYKKIETESDLIDSLVQNDNCILKSFEVLGKNPGWLRKNRSFISDLWIKLRLKQAAPNFWYRLGLISKGILDEEEVQKKYDESLEMTYPEYYHYLHREDEGIMNLGYTISSEVELMIKNFVNSLSFPKDISDSLKIDLKNTASRFKMVDLVKFCEAS